MEERVVPKVYEVKEENDEENIQYGDCGARIRLDGFSDFTSMYTQQGRKGVNQDSMTVWQVRNNYFFKIFFSGFHNPHEVCLSFSNFHLVLFFFVSYPVFLC